MIYEYPENFVIPVVYDKNLNPINRAWEFEYIQVDEEIVPKKYIEDNQININEYKYWGNMEKNYLNSEEDLLQKQNKDSMYSYCNLDYKDLSDEGTKEMLNDIDNEYACSETARV